MTLKRSILGALAAAVLVIPGWALASGDGTGITGSPHDFTDNVVAGVAGPPNIENDNANVNAWNNKRKEICRVCHVPHDHGAVRYGNQGILWNHEVTTKSSWQMYGSDPTMIDFLDNTPAAAPLGVSKLCLGCHDGVTAVNQYDGKTPTDAGYGGGTTYTMADYDAGFAIGNTTASLTNNHPISIAYVGDPDLQPTTATFNGSGETIASQLDNGRVECSTCHDVHNKDSVGGTHLLRSATKGADLTGVGASQLCLDCHIK